MTENTNPTEPGYATEVTMQISQVDAAPTPFTEALDNPTARRLPGLLIEINPETTNEKQLGLTIKGYTMSGIRDRGGREAIEELYEILGVAHRALHDTLDEIDAAEAAAFPEQERTTR